METKCQKVGKDELSTIRPGESRTYKVSSPKELQNVRASASYTHLTYPELGVKFKSSINRAKLEITVSAIAVNDSKN